MMNLTEQFSRLRRYLRDLISEQITRYLCDRPYKVLIVNIAENGLIQMTGQNEAQIKSVKFINRGAVSVFINGLELALNDDFEISANWNEYDITPYYADFAQPVGEKKLIVIVKYMVI